MRRFLVSMVAVGAMTLQPAFAQLQCKSEADQATFEVLALRSELMVLAMGCHDDDQYNAFMHRYQPDLQANEKAIDAYFKRTYGRSAQTEHDRFVTDLANAVSRQGTQLGGDFCPRNGAVFSEVMALPHTTELAEYAAAKDLVPPSLEICAVQAAPVRSPVRKAEIKTARR